MPTATRRSPRLPRRTAIGQPDAGRDRRQHHAVLADQHRNLVWAPVLGERGKDQCFPCVWEKAPELSLPVGFTVFPGEIFQAPRSWAEKVYPNLTLLERGRQGWAFRRLGRPQLFAERGGRFKAPPEGGGPGGGPPGPPPERAFPVGVPGGELGDMRNRINGRAGLPETDASQGVQLETIQALAAYWATDYDWRKFEERFAALPHFITEIDGVDIHFIHVRSEHEDALPLIVTHGWPGSTIEQLKIIDPLTDPTAHGADSADAFHLVIPSLPGHGFSASRARPAGTRSASPRPGWC